MQSTNPLSTNHVFSHIQTSCLLNKKILRHKLTLYLTDLHMFSLKLYMIYYVSNFCTFKISVAVMRQNAKCVEVLILHTCTLRAKCQLPATNHYYELMTL